MPFLTDLGCLYRDDERRSWDAARNNCIALGGDLFVPAHSEQFIALNSYLFSKGYTGKRLPYIFFLLIFVQQPLLNPLFTQVLLMKGRRRHLSVFGTNMVFNI